MTARTDQAVVVDMTDPGAREFVGLAQLKGMLSLHSKGLRRSRSPQATTIARNLGYRGGVDKQIEQVEARMAELLDEKEKRKRQEQAERENEAERRDPPLRPKEH